MQWVCEWLWVCGCVGVWVWVWVGGWVSLNFIAMLPQADGGRELGRGGGREGVASRQAIGAWYALWNVMLVVVAMMIYKKWMREKRSDDI